MGTIKKTAEFKDVGESPAAVIKLSNGLIVVAGKEKKFSVFS